MNEFVKLLYFNYIMIYDKLINVCIFIVFINFKMKF